jgi:alanyl-tRNA synthetase
VSSSNEKTLQATYLNNPLVIHIMEGVDMSILRERSDFMRQNQSESIHVLWAPPSIMVTANPEKIKNFHCGKFLSSLCTHFGGKGGGQEKSAQGQLALPAEGHESVLNWVKSQ